MFRHPHYLDIPWEIHWHAEPHAEDHRLWWLILTLTVLAMFVIGGGVISGA